MMGNFAANETNPSSHRTGSSPATGRHPGRKVLVVDDEQTFARRLAVAFAEAGFDAVPVFDGGNALEHLDDRHYDLVVLDYRMPDPDGGAVLRRVREGGKDTPVLLVTGDVTARPEAATLFYGECFVLRKPCTYQEIVKKAQSILEAQPHTDR